MASIRFVRRPVARQVVRAFVALLLGAGGSLLGTGSAYAIDPPPYACAQTVTGTGIGYDLGGASGPTAVCAAGAYAWVLALASPTFADVAAQGCAPVLPTDEQACAGMENLVRVLGSELATVYPAEVCVWIPVVSPAEGSYCNANRVSVGTYDDNGTEHLYVDAYLCPVPVPPSAFGTLCLPEATVERCTSISCNTTTYGPRQTCEAIWSMIPRSEGLDKSVCSYLP